MKRLFRPDKIKTLSVILAAAASITAAAALSACARQRAASASTYAPTAAFSSSNPYVQIMQGGYFTSSGFVPDSEPQTAVARAYSASDTADAGSPAQKTVPTVQTQGASDTADQAVSEMIRLGRLDKQLAASSDPGNAATVNGAAITKKQFDSYKATIASTNPAAAQSDRELLDALIDQELIYEQAVKAGYLATDAQVSSEITQSKQLMSQDPNQSRITSAYIAAQGLTEDQYWVNQQSAMKRSMTVTGYENKLRSDYMKQHASSNYNQTAQGFHTYLSGLEKQWRSGAKIVYYIA